MGGDAIFRRVLEILRKYPRVLAMAWLETCQAQRISVDLTAREVAKRLSRTRNAVLMRRKRLRAKRR